MNTDNLDTRQRYGAIAAITKTLTELIETLPDGEQLQTIENTTIDTLCDCHALFLPKDLFNAIASEATALRNLRSHNANEHYETPHPCSRNFQR